MTPRKHRGHTVDIEQRLEAVTMSLEFAARDIEALRAAGHGQSQRLGHLETLARQDGENIRALARIAQARETRISRVEDKK